ncbi:DNA-binding protein [Cohnella sp. LGH]|nr:DNA-binding protein [Cohnella sp. LGH]
MKMTEAREGHPFPSGMSRPALRALEGAGITTLEQVAGHSKAELLKLHGFGPKSIRLLHPALEEIGLTFAEKGRKQ